MREKWAGTVGNELEIVGGVVNTGDFEGPESITLAINDDREETMTLSVAGDTREEVSMTYRLTPNDDDELVANVSFDGKVVETHALDLVDETVDPELDDPPDDSDEEEATTTGDIPLTGAIGALVVGLFVVVVQAYVPLFAVLIAAELAEFDVISEWAELFVLYVPSALGGLLIFLVGIIVADVVARRMRGATVIQESDYGGWIVGAVNATILLIAAVSGLEMIGFELQIVYLIVDGLASVSQRQLHW